MHNKDKIYKNIQTGFTYIKKEEKKEKLIGKFQVSITKYASFETEHAGYAILNFSRNKLIGIKQRNRT